MSTAIDIDLSDLEQLDFEPRDVVRLWISCSWRNLYAWGISFEDPKIEPHFLYASNWRNGFATLGEAVTWLRSIGYERISAWETVTERVPEEQGTIWKADWAVNR